MNRQETLDYLTARGVAFELTEHAAAYTMQDIGAMELPYPEYDAKNLFVRDEKHRNFYLITVFGDKRVDLKEFRKQQGLKALSFASEEELMKLTKLTPGSVTPLGLLEDSECKVEFYLDSYFKGSRIGVHPNDNTATVWLEVADLLRLLKEHGTKVHFTDI